MRKWAYVNKEQINHLDLIKNFVQENPNAKIYVGTDSKFYRRPRGGFSVTYISVIGLDKGLKNGTNILLSREYIKGTGSDERITIYDRLWKEIEIAREIAVDIKNNCNIIPEVHIDLNPKESTKSNRLYAAAIGYMLEAGLEVKGKPDGPCASSAADHFLKYGY